MNEDDLYDAAEREMDLYRDEITRLRGAHEAEIASLTDQRNRVSDTADQLREQLAASDRIVRDILESLCRRDGLSLESTIEPGEPARNYALAERLGIGHVFGLNDAPAPELAAAMAETRSGSFEDMLADPHEQFDPRSELLASIAEYAAAPPASAGTEPPKLGTAWRLLNETRAERDKLREELDEIGVMAANAPEDGDSFGLLEEIAMRIAAHGVPDAAPADDDAKPETLRTFVIVGTGHQLPDAAVYVGTAPRTREGLVWHLYELPS